MPTVRILYTKEKYMRFLGHLELMRVFERTFRRYNYPLKFSEGFNPHPKMSFASPLALGYASKGDIMEVILNESIDIDRVKTTRFPNGITIIDAKYVSSSKSLMSSIRYAEYIISIEFTKNSFTKTLVQAQECIALFLKQETVTYEKKTKKGNLKTLNALEQIYELEVINSDESELIIKGILQTGNEGNLNPEQLIALVLPYLTAEAPEIDIRVERQNLYTQVNESLMRLYDFETGR